MTTDPIADLLYKEERTPNGVHELYLSGIMASELNEILREAYERGKADAQAQILALEAEVNRFKSLDNTPSAHRWRRAMEWMGRATALEYEVARLKKSWVSVSERLPAETSDPIPVIIDEALAIATNGFAKGKFLAVAGPGWYRSSVLASAASDEPVTHWLPLPALPIT